MADVPYLLTRKAYEAVNQLQWKLILHTSVCTLQMVEDIYFWVTQGRSTGRSRLLLCPTACDGLSSLLQMRISIATLLPNHRCMYRVWKGPLDPGSLPAVPDQPSQNSTPISASHSI